MAPQNKLAPDGSNPNSTFAFSRACRSNARAWLQTCLFLVLAIFFGRRPKKILDPIGKPRSILLFKPDGIGDFVLWTQVLRQFAERYPLSAVTMVCCAPVGALVLSLFPSWKVVEMPQRPRGLLGFIGLVFRHPNLLIIRSHEILVDLRPHRGPWEILYSAFLRASIKIGVVGPRQGMQSAGLQEEKFFDFLVAADPNRNLSAPNHECVELGLVDKFCTEVWAVPSADRAPDLRGFFQVRINKGKAQKKWVLAPFSGHPIRNYPLEKWVQALNQLVSMGDAPGHLSICGAQSQLHQAEALLDALRPSFFVENLAGQLKLPETAALLSKAELVFATESAAAHLSIALRRPSVVVLGGGHFGSFAPWGRHVAPVRWIWEKLPCYGCNWSCPYPRAFCITEISPARVAQAAYELLRNSSP